jgi:adenylate kinase
VGQGDLILMGPPGSGKGTQARRMVDELGYLQLSTGDLFRAHLSKGTELGRLAQSYMSLGQYVPDDVTVKMVRERLARVPLSTRIVFDGFPRTVAQAEALETLLKERGRSLAGVLLLDVPREELFARLSKRASVEGRADDTPEVISKRLDVYEDQTRPLIGYYEKRGLVRRVPAVGRIGDIAARVKAAVE